MYSTLYELALLHLQLKLLKVVGFMTPVSKPASFRHSQEHLNIGMSCIARPRVMGTSLLI